MPLIQSSLHLLPNPARVVIRPLKLASEPRELNPVDDWRMHRIIAAVRAMDTRRVKAELVLVLNDFENRHYDIRKVFEERYEQVARDIGFAAPLDQAQRQLIGACFCHEYSVGAAALMNPSIVPHPDQTNLSQGALRFILSLRAVGEGHISSVTFRQGVVLSDGSLELEPEPVDGQRVPRRIFNPYDQHQAFRDLAEDPRLLDRVESLIGPDFNLQHSKLNMKPAKVGSVVDWHATIDAGRSRAAAFLRDGVHTTELGGRQRTALLVAALRPLQR